MSPGAVRSADWLALIDENETWKLFDLATDPSQQRDLAAARPAILLGLKEDYLKWYRDISRGGTLEHPIQIDFSQPVTPLLLAHEGAIYGEGFDYAATAGWSQDWLVTTGRSGGLVQWAAQTNKDVEVDLILAYAAPDGPIPAGSLQVLVDDIPLLTAAKLPSYVPSKDEGERRFYTGEAPELEWKEVNLGSVILPKNMRSVRLKIVGSPPNKLMIKHVRIAPSKH